MKTTVLLMTSVVMMFVVVVEPAELKSGPNPLYNAPWMKKVAICTPMPLPYSRCMAIANRFTRMATEKEVLSELEKYDGCRNLLYKALSVETFIECIKYIDQTDNKNAKV